MASATPATVNTPFIQSILGGIFRGTSQNNASAALQTHNVTQNNPLTTQWIGISQNANQNAPIQKEGSQNVQLPWYTASTGTGFSYSKPLPTDIPSIAHQVTPAANSATDPNSSNVGSLVNPAPSSVPIGNYSQFQGYQMNPQNAEQWHTYYANAMGNVPLKRQPNAANVLAAVTAQTNIADGNGNDPQFAANQLQTMMTKNYQPSRQFWGFSSPAAYSPQ